MTTSAAQTSPQPYARLAGLLYFFIIVVGTWDEVFVRGRIVVSGDAAATAHNMAASEQLWRLGFTGEVTMWVASIVTMTIFYFLLRPVNRFLALLALLFNLVDTAVETVNAGLCNFAALFLSTGGGSLSAADPKQLRAFAAFALRLHEYGFGVGLLFFACFLVLTGYLFVRSTYFPAWLGVLAAVGGICYAINSYALFAAPALAEVLFPYILVPSFIAELSISLWLIVIGVNVPKWRERGASF